MALPDYLSALLDERSYPHPCPRIELIETHISWVILTGDFAYKLKKPVQFNFVDFSTLTLREHFCREEVRCNRAFAPQLYLGVVAVQARVDGLVILHDPNGDVLEWAVKMRQFDPELGLDRVLAREELEAAALRTFGADLAARHAALPVHEGRAEEVPRRIFGPVEDNFSEILGTALGEAHRERLTELLAAARALGDVLRPTFDRRMTGGRVRECHGDLHLANLALIEGVVTAFDCLEFNANLRWIDTMSDVAFLFMDCHFRGETELAYQFLDGYLDASGDYDGVRLLQYFSAYRAVVRAKVAALRWVQAPDEATARSFTDHIDWTRRALERPPGMLILTCGLSGSGKSTLAGRLLGVLPAVRLRSDVARKVLAGLGTLEASASPVDAGLYSAEQTELTFDFLVTLAKSLVLAGEHVIVDATFIERARRDQFAQLAAGIGAAFRVLYCQAPVALLESRLSARAASGADPSEAGLEVLNLQRSRFEPPSIEESVIAVDMSEALDAAAIARLVTAIQSG